MHTRAPTHARRLACGYGHADIVQVLLERKANCNAPNNNGDR